MNLVPISQSNERLFLDVALAIYQHIPNWIRPLDKDILYVFDPAKNKAFRFGKAQRWVLQNELNQPIGRIAAFVNERYKSKGDRCLVGGIGFFECINDQAAANRLFNTAKQWLTEQGVGAIDAPINFGERDKWWGLLVEGFQEPTYGMNYHPPYYQSLFESFGFRPFFEQFCFGLRPKEPLSPKIWERHALIAKDPAFSARHAKKNQLDAYATDFTTIYNKAWAGHGGLKSISNEQTKIMFQKMKPVMDERLLWFVYHHNEPIAFFINLPDLNQWFKYLNGRFGLLDQLRFLWIKKTKPNKKFVGLVFGVVPAFQGTGVDAYLIGESAKMIQSDALPYTEFELQWIGDFNPKMISIAKNLGDSFVSRKLITYRLMLNPDIPFERHPIL